MTNINPNRVTVDLQETRVVFLLGMRVNKWWKPHKWLPVSLSMGHMLKELYANPDLGFISHEAWGGRTSVMLQYWKSFEQLEAYAQGKQHHHLPAWSRFNSLIGNSTDVGIWHETYVIGPGSYECIYHNMPPFGLARTAAIVPASGPFKSARTRLQHGQKM